MNSRGSCDAEAGGAGEAGTFATGVAAAVGVVLCNEAGKIVFETARCIGVATNNMAEYNAMILALESAYERQARHVLCHADSELIVFQLQGRYRIINVWRPLNGSVQSAPLAFASAASVKDTGLVPVEHRYPDRSKAPGPAAPTPAPTR